MCYSGDRVGSVAVYFCDDGYRLEGDSTRQCLSSGHWNGTTPLCTLESGNSKIEHYTIPCCISNFLIDFRSVVVGVVCSLVFLSVGVLLGAVSVYLLLRARDKLSLPPSSSPPPVPPAATYEEVDVSGEVTSTQKIQLNTNEAYAFRETIPTSPNTAYGQVEL